MRPSLLCPYPLRLVQRFWSKVAVCEHGASCKACCWEWLAGKTRGGYGHLSIPKAYRTGYGKLRRANRVCWEIVCGPIPEGLFVLHNCPAGDNPGCVSYWHLWLGTHEDNVKDSIRKGRNAKGLTHGTRTHPETIRRGEANHYAKLTAVDIVPIFREAIAGATYAEIATPRGIGRATVGLILQRKIWGHVVVPEALLTQRACRLPALRPIRGERAAGAKLTPAQVLVIRQKAREGVTHDQLAREYHVSFSNISAIVRRSTWAWLPDAPDVERREAC